jgi:hypothetical protein
LLALGGVGVVALGLGAVLLIVAAVLSMMLYNQARASEAS